MPRALLLQNTSSEGMEENQVDSRLALNGLRGRLENPQLGLEVFERFFSVFSPDSIVEILFSPATGPIFEHPAVMRGEQAVEGATEYTARHLASEGHHSLQTLAKGTGRADESFVFLAVGFSLLLLVPIPVVGLPFGSRRYWNIISDVLDAPLRTVLRVNDPELLADLRDQLLEECLGLVDLCTYLAIGVFDTTISQVVVHPPAEATKSFDGFEVFQRCFRLLLQFQPITSFLDIRVFIYYQKILSMSRVFWEKGPGGDRTHDAQLKRLSLYH